MSENPYSPPSENSCAEPSARGSIFWKVICFDLVLFGLFIVLFRYCARVIPIQGQMFEGMGASLPILTRLFLYQPLFNWGISLFLLLFYLFQHVLLFRSFKVFKWSSITLIILTAALLSLFWYAGQLPIWEMQRVMGQ